MDSRWLGVVLTAAVLFAAPGAWAQSDETRFDVQQLNPMPSQLTNYFGLSSAQVLESGQWEIGLFGHFADDPLVLRTADGDRIESIVGNQMTMNVLGSIGLEDIFEIGFDVPIILSQSGDEVSRIGDVNASDVSGGVGDFRVVPKVQFFNSNTDDEPGGAAIGFLLNTYLPSGEQDNFQGEGFRIEPRLAMDAVLRSGTRFSLNVGYMVRESIELENLTVGGALTYGLGAEFVTSQYLRVVAEFAGSAVLGAEELENEELPLEALFGFKIRPIETLVISLGGGGGLIEGAGTPDFRVFFGISGSVIPDRDPDRDGIFGDDDQCPLNPEDLDGFEDADGCPDPDNDEDGVLDVYDGCPMDPEDRDGYEDEDGCPDPDNDLDGLMDYEDECPLDPEDIDGWEDLDGCPDIDNDADGILDVSDDCRNNPEDFDGWEDADGCPDPDNDADGILDVDDDCPDEPETWNAFEDDDGCPDESIIEVTCDAIIIYEKVYFETNSDEIRSRSFNLLNQIADVMHARPDIRRIRVEGHTDNRGSDSHNLELSDRRANSVRLYLMDRGIDSMRIESQGFGEAQPIADNESSNGRAENRRVEFVITEQEGCQ
jgi:outer membrane protein OmpA-like peptidoglycan-associated protein